MKKYIRFGNLPNDLESTIHKGDSTFKQQLKGVSVWECYSVNDIQFPKLPQNPTEDTLADYFYCLLGNKPVFIVTGTEVGQGAVGEPLLGQDIKIVKEITEDYNYLKTILIR